MLLLRQPPFCSALRSWVDFLLKSLRDSSVLLDNYIFISNITGKRRKPLIFHQHHGVPFFVSIVFNNITGYSFIFDTHSLRFVASYKNTMTCLNSMTSIS